METDSEHQQSREYSKRADASCPPQFKQRGLPSNTHFLLRSLPSRTPSPSNTSSSSLSASSSNMLQITFDNNVQRRLQHLTLSNGVAASPTPCAALSPAPAPSQCHWPRERRLPASAIHDGYELEIGLDQNTEHVTSMYPRTGSSIKCGRDQFEAFRLTKSRVVRLFNLPSSSSAIAHSLKRLFFASSSLNPASRSPDSNNSPPSNHSGILAPVRMWTLREECGGSRPGEEESIWAVFQSHEEAFAALSLTGSISITTALETDLEPYAKLRRYELKNVPSQPALSSHPMPHEGLPSNSDVLRYTPGTEAGFLQVGAESSPRIQRGHQLSSNPPNARSVFRQGDWICSSPSCAAHNFGRNAVCIGCGGNRSLGLNPSPTSNGVVFPSTRIASPRFGPGSNNTNLVQTPSPSSPAFPGHVSKPPPPPFVQHQIPLKPTVPQHALLTPSGQALASGGKVQNISSDPLSPCIMFWPDNEPLPEQGQIRPTSLANVHQPPIMNTGNKGPIEHQPGDWICQKCDYLNWRRRKVCQTCYPYAEGNGDSVSSTMQAERLALLAAVVAQSQAAQLGFQQSLQVQQPSLQYPYGTPAANSSLLSTYPMRRTTLATSRPNLAVNPRVANQVFARRAISTPEIPSGNIVYQTPPSPAAIRHPNPSDEKPLPHAGPHLPSFLKNEIKQGYNRTPLSLSPCSSASADLSFDELDESVNSPPGRLAATSFYAQKNTGSGPLSSASGSTSSLTLGGSMGGSIWSLDRDEDKAWSSAVFPSSDILSTRSRTTSFEVKP